MRNLAGQTTAHADAYIEDELNEAGIAFVRGTPSQSEVPASIHATATGKLGVISGTFEFKRAWYYWVVRGPVPIDLAWELYNDPRGKEAVRVGGHCGCPEPGGMYVNPVDGIECVNEYHIDTQDGLNLFAEKVLGTRPPAPTDEEKEAAKEIARNNRSGRVIYTDTLEEADYLAAQQEVQEIRSAISDLRHRLDDLSRLTGDETANTVAHTLTAAIVTLYELENPADARSFARRAEGRRKMWEDLYANPINYVLKENSGER